MDFSRFAFSRKYGNKEVFFDFNLSVYTGHKGKGFRGFASLKAFLESNPDRHVYLTLDYVQDFQEEDEKLIINLKSYQDFSKAIAQNSKNRFQAFLAQKTKRYSEDDKKKVLASSTEQELVENIKPEILEKIRSLKEPEVVESKSVVVVSDENKKQVLESILERGYSNDFWELLATRDPNLTDNFAAARLQAHRRKIIEELKERLVQDSYKETSGDDSWQSWIYKHNWLFGINYQEPIEKAKINISGVMPDYIFPTLDDFVDILEIKLPSKEVVEKDEDHSGSWVWSKDTNYAIGQVVNYLCEIDRLRYEIEKEIELKYGKKLLLLKPRAFILIGKTDGWDTAKREGLRKLNDALHGIEVLTYSDLVNRGDVLLRSTLKTYES